MIIFVGGVIGAGKSTVAKSLAAHFSIAYYDEARRIAGGFIVIWVQAREDIIIERLGTKKRTGHLLDDPLPLHNAIKRDFEEYNRCIIDCPNNGPVEETVADLVHLIDSIAELASCRPTTNR
jgi:gluconate kinase